MNLSFQIPAFITLLTSAIICGAWWYVAVRRKNVGLFYWLASAHTLSFAIHALQLGYSLNKASAIRFQSISPMFMLVGVVLAALYVTLARWLVEQTGDSDQG